MIPLSFYLNRDRSEGYETYILIDDGHVQGLVSYHIRDFTNVHDTMYLSRIGVREGQHGKGYGSDLWMFMISKCVEKGVIIMCCEALRDVSPFFMSLGWEPILTYDDPHWGEGCVTLIFHVPR